MKKLCIAFILCVAGLGLHGQGVWMELGLKGGYGLGGYYNATIMDDGDHKFKIGSGPSYGPVMGLYFNESNALSIEALFSNNKQEFELKNALANQKLNTLKWNTIDLVLAYRLTNEGGYVEIGPQYRMLRSVEQTVGGETIKGDAFKKNFENTLGFVFGLGGYFAGSKYFTLSAGLRFQYAITNLASKDGQDLGHPASYKTWNDLKGTHPFNLQLQVGATFPIGGYAQAQCGRRGFIFGSGR